MPHSYVASSRTSPRTAQCPAACPFPKVNSKKFTPPRSREANSQQKISPLSVPMPDPVPDAPIDYTELWKAVSMAKESDAAKSSQAAHSNKGTEAYDNILHLLGID